MNSLLKLITNNEFNINTKFGDIIHGKRIMVLSPHHDDEVLGLGGTLLRYVQEDTDINLVYLTDGSKGIPQGEKNVRMKEAVEVWNNNSYVCQHFWNLKDGELEQHRDITVSKLKELLMELKPDVIYTPWILDKHLDHQATTIFLKEALTDLKIDDTIVACYEVMSPLFSNHTVNITKEYEEKYRLINMYKSQHSYLCIQETTKYLNEFRASMLRLRKIKYAEGFFVLSAEHFKLFIEKIISVND